MNIFKRKPKIESSDLEFINDLWILLCVINQTPFRDPSIPEALRMLEKDYNISSDRVIELFKKYGRKEWFSGKETDIYILNGLQLFINNDDFNYKGIRITKWIQNEAKFWDENPKWKEIYEKVIGLDSMECYNEKKVNEFMKQLKEARLK